jgi:hypothetical protein
MYCQRPLSDLLFIQLTVVVYRLQVPGYLYPANVAMNRLLAITYPTRTHELLKPEHLRAHTPCQRGSGLIANNLDGRNPASTLLAPA